MLRLHKITWKAGATEEDRDFVKRAVWRDCRGYFDPEHGDYDAWRSAMRVWLVRWCR